MFALPRWLQRFRQADGVAPILGGMLFIGLTATLSAGVFYYTSEVSAPTQATPVIWFNADDADRSLSVVQAPIHLSWGDLELAGCSDPQLVASSGTVAWDERTDLPIIGGDRIRCSNGVADLLIHFGPSNGIVYAHPV